MLAELTIRNFAIIDQVTLRLAPGLNVLTGETGAGKSIIVDAVSAVVGGRTSSEVVRSGARSALIEAVFELDQGTANAVTPVLEREGLTGDDPRYLILSREVRAGGRSVARVNGRTTAASIVRELGETLVDIHGQTEHLSLLRVPEHIHYLDRYAQSLPLRAQLASLVEELNRVRSQLRSLRDDSRARHRRLERLQYEMDEIKAARLLPDEEETLRQERSRLANAERLVQFADAAYQALYGGGDEVPAAYDLTSHALEWLTDLARIDSSMADARQKAEALAIELEELARTIRTYSDKIEYNPERLQEVEDRLAVINNLKRKYGANIEEILAYAERAAAELAELSDGEQRAAELEERQEALLARLSTIAKELSKRRREAAIRLAQAVENQLADLAMEHSRFEVAFSYREATDGIPIGDKRLAFDRTGIDRVEFMLAPNPGEPMRPLARIASGGENSRLMLALKTVLSQEDDTPTLIFDEIDTGIGGRMGHVIGEKLATLAKHHQVLCVTHLPQLAAFADTHVSIRKEVVHGRTRTIVSILSPDERQRELAAMMGGVSQATLRSAHEMVQRARKA